MSMLPTSVESGGLSAAQGTTLSHNPYEALEGALESLREALSACPADSLHVGRALDALWEAEDALDAFRAAREEGL